jgi:hypothetical protein
MTRMRQPNTLVTRVAVLDGFVVLGLLAIGFVTSGVPNSPNGWVLVAVAGAVLALITFWRSYRHCQQVLAGTASWYRLPLEGFAIGFLPPFALFVLPAVDTAIAAGSLYDGAATWGPRNWVSYLAFAVWFSSIFGFIGAATGYGLSLLNRVLLRGDARQ